MYLRGTQQLFVGIRVYILYFPYNFLNMMSDVGI